MFCAFLPPSLPPSLPSFLHPSSSPLAARLPARTNERTNERTNGSIHSLLDTASLRRCWPRMPMPCQCHANAMRTALSASPQSSVKSASSASCMVSRNAPSAVTAHSQPTAHSRPSSVVHRSSFIVRRCSSFGVRRLFGVGGRSSSSSFVVVVGLFAVGGLFVVERWSLCCRWSNGGRSVADGWLMGG